MLKSSVPDYGDAHMATIGAAAINYNDNFTSFTDYISKRNYTQVDDAKTLNQQCRCII